MLLCSLVACDIFSIARHRDARAFSEIVGRFHKFFAVDRIEFSGLAWPDFLGSAGR